MDADVSKLCRSVSPHPVRCPVKREKDMSCEHKRPFLCPNGCILDLIITSFWKSDMWDTQVDGSLHVTPKHALIGCLTCRH